MRNYGTLSLTVTSPVQSFTEPITAAQAKKFLEIPERSPVDAQEDALIEAMCTAAREIAELYQNRDLVQKQYDLYLDDFPAEIELRQPLVSVDLLKYRDSAGTWTTLVEGTDYIVDTARGLVMPVYGGSWPSFTPWPSSPILVRFTSGLSATDAFWNDAGTRVKIGMRYLIAHWFSGRLPFEPGVQTTTGIEYPWTVTMCLSAGAVPRVK